MFEGENKIYIGVLLATVTLLLVMSGFLFMALRFHRSRRLLNRQQVFAEIQAVEKDRKRIAADLHDEIGSLLTFVKLKLSSMPVEGVAKQEAESVRQHLNSMHDSLLAITNDLLPNTLERNGLLHTIEEFITEIEARASLSVTYQASPEAEASVAPHLKVHIYRIITELVQNTIKHARAGNINLHLSLRKNKMHLRYSDDGKGFNLRKDLRRKEGLGLKNINSRVELLQGQLLLKTGNNKGVCYEILIPVYEKHKTTDSR